MPRPKLNRKQVIFYLSDEEIAKIDLLADGIPRAEWLRATIRALFVKQFPNYSSHAQRKIMANDTLSVAQGALPRQTITTTQLCEMAGERSQTNPHDTAWLYMYDWKGRKCGHVPFELSQKGLNEVLPKLIEYGKLQPDIDYIYKHEPYTPPAPVTPQTTAPQQPDPRAWAAENARIMAEAARKVAEEDAARSAQI